MAEFVKKSRKGYTEVEHGIHDPEYSYVILEKEEYNELKEEIYRAEKRAQEAESKAFDRIRTLEWNQMREIAELNNSIEDLKQMLAEEQNKVEIQKDLNKNLLRICRERANAKRGLKEQKYHSGYVVLRMTDREHNYQESGNWKTVIVYETVLQTPYTVDHSRTEAGLLIDELFFGKTTDCSEIIVELGIVKKISSVEEFNKALIARKLSNENTVFKVLLSANHKTGFWEVKIFHTRPIDNVPWDWSYTSRKSGSSE